MTRKLLTPIAALALVLMAVGLFAQKKTVTLTGYLIDNACAATATAGKPLGTLVKDHPVSCATMEDCEKSGYAVYADSKLYKFDEAGNTRAKELLKTTKSKIGFKVKVVGTIEGETITVESLSEPIDP